VIDAKPIGWIHLPEVMSEKSKAVISDW
jgi:hypothetical protein